MKTLFRIFLFLFVLLLVLVGAALFILTRPGVQQRLVEGQLPAGSSIRTVRVSASSLEFSQLKLALPDGSRVRLESFATDFKPLDILFNRTLKLGAVNVAGLVVEIPASLLEGSSPSDPALPQVDDPARVKPARDDVAGAAKPVEAKTARSPAEAIYSIGELDWLIDIESIRLDGELLDGAGSRYAMDLRAGAIRPGLESSIEASLKLSAAEALPAGLKEFDASAQLWLKQKTGGGFEQIRLESSTQASDQAGNKLLAISQQLEASMQGFEERAALAMNFKADLPRPEIFLPELTAVGPLVLEGRLAVGAARQQLTLTETELLITADGAELLTVRLNKDFALGGKQDLSGNLMDLRLTNLPLAWLAPWLPEGWALAGEDLSAQFNLTGLAGGEMQLSSEAPLRIGPVSLQQHGVPQLNQVTLVLQPVIRLAADQSITWELTQLQVLDRYGEVLSGQSTGRFDPTLASSGWFPSGLQTQTRLELGLLEMAQQPALAAYTSILSGRASVDLQLAAGEPEPLRLVGNLAGLSLRSFPGQMQDYRFALQLSEPAPGQLGLGVSLQAGPVSRPSSDLQLAGQVQPAGAPIQFKLDLNAARLSQRDIECLSAAFQGQSGESPADPAVPVRLPPGPTAPQTGAPTLPVAGETAAGPPWAGYDGALTVAIAELVLSTGEVIADLKAQLVVSEPLLRLSQLEAALKSGKISGEAEARYSAHQRMAYTFRSDVSFANLDPAVFSRQPGSTFPVQGQFDGRAQFSGQGETLDQALDAVEGDVLVTGREGLLTAFQLDTRSNLGLIGASLLGDRLNRPGISALAKTVPYFENMPFSDFTLKLQRRSDKRIEIPQLRFVGRNVLIDGKGSIAASSLKDALQQPLDLTLELGAKGQLIEYLDTLRLLGAQTGADGFRRWGQSIQVKGSLGDPDTSVLERVLKEAANRALTQPGSNNEVSPDAGRTPAAPAGGQNLLPKPSKEERILRDVETGLQLLFGQ